jgi:hypothetical protein
MALSRRGVAIFAGFLLVVAMVAVIGNRAERTAIGTGGPGGGPSAIGDGGGGGGEEPPADMEARESPDGGYNVESHPGRFSTWLPGYPYPTDRTITTSFGPAQLHALSHDGMRVSCSVIYMDRPATDDRPPTEVFADVGSGVARMVGGSVLRRRERALGPYPGLEILVNATQPRLGTHRVRVYLVGSRVYILSVFMLPGAELDPEVDRCFDSLAIEADGKSVGAGAAPPAPKAELSDVLVVFTQESPPGTKRTLLVHRDGVVELLRGDRHGHVVRRLPKGRADLAKLERIFGASAWAELPEASGGARTMYLIESHGHVVKRADPLDINETAFMDAMGVLGELWIYAERADRPGEAPPPSHEGG